MRTSAAGALALAAASPLLLRNLHMASAFCRSSTCGSASAAKAVAAAAAAAASRRPQWWGVGGRLSSGEAGTSGRRQQAGGMKAVREKTQHQYDNIWDCVSVDTRGPHEVTKELVEASRLQWAYGFPMVPAGMTRLTHGFHYYPASMQAATAKHLLETVLPGNSVADPFVGGGTVVIEGLRAGRATYGADISPLALFVARGRTWLPPASTLDALEAAIDAAAAGVSAAGTSLRSWEPVRCAVAAAAAEHAELAPALWFAYSTALQQAAKARHSARRALVPPHFYRDCARGYVARVRELVAAVTRDGAAPLPPPPSLLRCDARRVQWPAGGVDAILTSPPYPGVYDYLSYAREVRSKVGAAGASSSSAGGTPAAGGGDHRAATEEAGAGAVGTVQQAAAAAEQGFLETEVPAGRGWPSQWQSDEMGAFRSLKKDPRGFKSTWQQDHTAWITNVSHALSPGGRMAVQIGDGAGGCALESTLKAASEAGGGDVEGEGGGLVLVGSATLRSKADSRWNMRTEHLIILERRQG